MASTTEPAVVAPALLELLRCPLTKQRLALAPPELARRFGLPSALVREDGKLLYPIRDGIPLLFAVEGIAL